MPKRIIPVLTGVFFVLASCAPAPAAAVDDDFGQAKKIQSKYFVTYYSPQSDIYDFLQQLDIGPVEKFLTGKSPGNPGSAEEDLASNIDALFMRVSDILDMHLYSFNSTIKICRDYGHLKRVYSRIFDKELNSPSFYVFDLNTIYISAENLKSEILGHEMGHSIINRYFAVSPPTKIQEVLCGYVEYQLRKPNTAAGLPRKEIDKAR